MDTTNAPQIFEYLNLSLDFTPFHVKWLPNSPQFALLGQTPKMEGIFKLMKLDQNKLVESFKMECGKGFKSCSFNYYKEAMGIQSDEASSSNLPTPSSNYPYQIAIGDISGKIYLVDLEKQKIFHEIDAHKGMVNSIDSIGGIIGSGVLEILSGGSDGCVRLWDPRQEAPVVALEPNKDDMPSKILF
jgi:WD40 repeat protein